MLQYAKYVDGLKVAESEPGCEQCEDNRLMLEKAWQVIASEFFDPHREFSQAKWVAALQHTLQVCCSLEQWRFQHACCMGAMRTGRISVCTWVAQVKSSGAALVFARVCATCTAWG